jgi:adsorption protein B
MGAEMLDTVARTVAYAVGTGIFVNLLDDMFVDARYFASGLDKRSSRKVAEEDLMRVAQKRTAIMLPAWNEAEVIEQMLEHNLTNIDFDRGKYDIFCGTYQNDPETQARVDAMALRFPEVHKVVVPHDGPTSKADCLNWIYQGIIVEERRRGQRYDILLMHDAEDIIHPLALRLYSLLIPPNDFVQTPVFSLPLPKKSVVAATYIDEFAEHHVKEMRVRESLGGLVPSAGVGSAFARDAFEEIATAHGQHPFNVDSLTEDYEIGLKFRLAERKTHFACRTVERHTASGVREEFIATREFFPSGFGASVRQRSRWILGITLQTWAQIGWRGSLPVLYCLWRDRKALLTNALLLAAYCLLAYGATRSAITHAGGGPWTLDAMVPAGSVLAWMVSANLASALWRLGMKARFVGMLYGPWHALLSAPRLVISNAIGILATMRAVSQYAAHRLRGEPLRWLKTAHEFPTPERLAAARRRLGELLLEMRAVSTAELDEALSLQRATGGRLGEVLTMSGLVSARGLNEALGRQLDLATVDPEGLTVSLALLRRLPEQLAEDLDVLPLEEREGRVIVAASEPLPERDRAQLRRALGAPIELRIAPRGVLAAARDRAYRRLISERPPPLLMLDTHRAPTSRRAVAQLGLGFCAFHGVAPLRTTPPRVLTTAPLHDSVREHIVAQLGVVPTFIVAPPAAVRIALALAEGSVVADDAGQFGLDGVEWRALTAELETRADLRRHVRDARDRGLSPLDYFEAIRGADPRVLARARARTFGLQLSERGGESARGLLPPRIVAANDVTVVHRDDDSVVFASPRPTARIAQQAALLLSPIKVAWSVAPGERS